MVIVGGRIQLYKEPDILFICKGFNTMEEANKYIEEFKDVPIIEFLKDMVDEEGYTTFDLSEDDMITKNDLLPLDISSPTWVFGCEDY